MQSPLLIRNKQTKYFFELIVDKNIQSIYTHTYPDTES